MRMDKNGALSGRCHLYQYNHDSLLLNVLASFSSLFWLTLTTLVSFTSGWQQFLSKNILTTDCTLAAQHQTAVRQTKLAISW